MKNIYGITLEELEQYFVNFAEYFKDQIYEKRSIKNKW